MSSRALAFAPDIDERRREKRQPARLAGDVVDERVDERRLHLEPRPLGRTLDRAAELGSGHRPEQDVVRPDEVGQLDVRSEMAEEVRAQRDQHDRAALRIPRSFDERVDERMPLLLADHRREQLLELVDRENRYASRRGGSGSPGRTSAYSRPSAGSKPARRSDDLPLPDAPDDREQRRVLEPADELVDEALAAEEELLVRRLERGESLERADVAERVRPQRRRRRGSA